MNKARIRIKGTHTIVRLMSSVSINLIVVLNLFSQASPFQVAPLFQDNMVLQQQRHAPIWGKGIPGTNVIVKTSWGKSVSTVVGPDGRWIESLLTPKAGGPFQISIRHGNSLIVLRNIMTGEVWLCSGQSNMEMPLEGWPPADTIMNSANEIEGSLYPTIRLFSVKRSIEAAPSDSCTGSWVECSPLDVRGFSATAFYFGKVLQNHLHIPIGLINTSYGGTCIESWMSKEALQSFKEYSDQLNKIDECKDNLHLLAQWIHQHPSINLRNRDPQHKWEGLNFEDEHCADRDFNDSAWQIMNLPTYWERTSMGEFDGAVWFRKLVVIPSAWIGKDLTLQLGPIDDMDETFVNGQKAGQYLGEGYWKVDRVYKIAGSSVRDSLLTLAVRVIDYQGGGGIWGNGKKMVVYPDSINAGISLTGAWKYLPVAEYQASIFYVFGSTGNEFLNRPKFPINFSANTPTTLFNAMIHPLIPFAIRGAIWYQGESNVSNPAPYEKLFTSMIADWRKLFLNGDFPFYFVQLAPFNYGPQSKSQLLRESQLRTLSVKNTGMAVTLDIGNPNNIHPTNKEDVGKRLALWALTKTYKKNIAFTGPIYKSMKAIKGKIILSFDYAGNGLVLKGRAGDLNFLVAGPDRVFKKAVVRVQGNTLIVSHPEILEPLAVRYAWSNIEEGTFFNKEGLPASSFRTDDWRE
jgi:sialate O-acetylesterase